MFFTNILRKESDIKWNIEAIKYFEETKKALDTAPIFESPYYAKDFIILFFASEHTIAMVLMHKIQQGNEQPITFFSIGLRDSSLKYNIMQKKVYALVKYLKDFRVYVLHSHVIAYFPNVVVKEILTQADPEGRRGRWIATFIEYDVEIKPSKLIKGQGIL